MLAGVEESGTSGKRGNSGVAEQNGREQRHGGHRRVGIPISPALPRSHEREDQRASKLQGENDDAENKEYYDYKLVLLILQHIRSKVLNKAKLKHKILIQKLIKSYDGDCKNNAT